MASKAPIQPIGNYILVKPKEQETTTPSGLVLSASTSKEKPQIGEVIALGTGKTDKDGKKVEWNVKVGDEVLFRKYSPDEFEWEGTTYLVMKEEDVMAVIK